MYYVVCVQYICIYSWLTSFPNCSPSAQEPGSVSVVVPVVALLHAIPIPASSPAAPTACQEGRAGPPAQEPDHRHAESHTEWPDAIAERHQQEHRAWSPGATAAQKERTQTWQQGRRHGSVKGHLRVVNIHQSRMTWRKHAKFLRDWKKVCENLSTNNRG